MIDIGQWSEQSIAPLLMYNYQEPEPPDGVESGEGLMLESSGGR